MPDRRQRDAGRDKQDADNGENRARPCPFCAFYSFCPFWLDDPNSSFGARVAHSACPRNGNRIFGKPRYVGTGNAGCAGALGMIV